MLGIAPEVASLMRIGLVQAEGLTVRGLDAQLWVEMENLAGGLRARYAGQPPAQIEGVQAARRLYHDIGIDPTKLRPSSEALLRRVLRGLGLPQINTLVDVNNLCSLEWLLPIGLHDLDRTKGRLILRRGRPQEGYEAIGKGWYSVEDRLTLCDETGPCGTPTSDSQRTMITPETRRALMVIYAPASYALDQLSRHTTLAAERITRYCGGRIAQTSVMGAGTGS